MANLTPAEKELLAVLQYFGNNIKPVARLVRKLSDNFGLETTEYMTKLPESIIDPLILSVTPKPKKPKVAQAIEDAKAVPAKLNKAAEEISVTESAHETTKRTAEEMYADRVVKSTGNSERLTIHLDTNSDTIQRIAYDVTKAIESEFIPGDKIWNSRDLAVRFGTNGAYVAKVYRVLRDHNWIEYIDPNRKNLGHRVK